jgi:hypothetical protein
MTVRVREKHPDCIEIDGDTAEVIAVVRVLEDRAWKMRSMGAGHGKAGVVMQAPLVEWQGE